MIFCKSACEVFCPCVKSRDHLKPMLLPEATASEYKCSVTTLPIPSVKSITSRTATWKHLEKLAFTLYSYTYQNFNSASIVLCLPFFRNWRCYWPIFSHSLILYWFIFLCSLKSSSHLLSLSLMFYRSTIPTQVIASFCFLNLIPLFSVSLDSSA